MTAGRVYAPQLDSLRGLAIAAVLYNHLYENSSGLGHLGVSLFFVLSGFLITDILLAIKEGGQSGRAKWTGIFNFYARRALRIWPLYFLLLSLAVAVDFQGIRAVAAWHALFASNILFAIRNEYVPWTTAPWWSLSVEEQFYLLWPFAIVLLNRRAIPWLIVGVIVSGAAFQAAIYAMGFIADRAHVLLPASTHALGAGALLAWVWRRDRRFPSWLPFLGAAAAVVALIVRQVPGNGWLSDAVAVISMAALVAAAFVGVGGPIGRLLDLAPLRFLGRISFGLYLVHSFVLWVLYEKAAAKFPALADTGPAVFLVGSAISIAVASTSWIVLEAPINRLKRYFPYRTTESLKVGAPLSA